MASSVKKLRYLSFTHVAFAVLAVSTGIAAINVTDYYIGVFGMGIWLGGWILVTGLAGMASAGKPGNFCRIGVFLGCCLVAIVVLSICSVIIGTVVIKHFQFESTVTRDYYKNKGTFGRTSHDNYFKPDKYFEERNKAGRVGLAVYGSLMVIIICDVLLGAVSIYVCRDITMARAQAVNMGSNNHSIASTQCTQAAPGVVPIAGQSWAELVLPAETLQPIHLLQNSDFQYFTPCKLPNYAELYPEGISNLALDASAPPPVNVPDEPPPAYTPTAEASVVQHTSLPGSPVVVALNLHTSPSTEQTIAEDSVVSSWTSTPLVERSSSDSSERTGTVEDSSEYPGSSTSVHLLHPGDLETTIPMRSMPASLVTDLSSTPVTTNSQETLTNVLVVSSNSSARIIHSREGSVSSLPNSVEVNTSLTPHHEPPNDSTNFENASVTAAATDLESR